MRSPEDIAASWTAGAVVVVEARQATGRPPALARPAAFVFPTAQGLAWVEPQYADPAGAGTNALHTRAGTVQVVGTLLVLDAEGERITALPYDPEEDRDLVGQAMEWWAGWLADTGEEFATERARVRDLAGIG